MSLTIPTGSKGLLLAGSVPLLSSVFDADSGGVFGLLLQSDQANNKQNQGADFQFWNLQATKGASKQTHVVFLTAGLGGSPQDFNRLPDRVWNQIGYLKVAEGAAGARDRQVLEDIVKGVKYVRPKAPWRHWMEGANPTNSWYFYHSYETDDNAYRNISRNDLRMNRELFHNLMRREVIHMWAQEHPDAFAVRKAARPDLNWPQLHEGEQKSRGEGDGSGFSYRVETRGNDVEISRNPSSADEVRISYVEAGKNGATQEQVASSAELDAIIEELKIPASYFKRLSIYGESQGGVTAMDVALADVDFPAIGGVICGYSMMHRLSHEDYRASLATSSTSTTSTTGTTAIRVLSGRRDGLFPVSKVVANHDRELDAGTFTDRTSLLWTLGGHVGMNKDSSIMKDDSGVFVADFIRGQVGAAEHEFRTNLVRIEEDRGARKCRTQNVFRLVSDRIVSGWLLEMMVNERIQHAEEEQMDDDNDDAVSSRRESLLRLHEAIREEARDFHQKISYDFDNRKTTWDARRAKYDLHGQDYVAWLEECTSALWAFSKQYCPQ